MLVSNLICFRYYYLSNLVCNNFISYSDDGNVSMNFYVICDMYVESCTILVVCGSFIETRHGTRQTTRFIWAQV